MSFLSTISPFLEAFDTVLQPPNAAAARSTIYKLLLVVIIAKRNGRPMWIFFYITYRHIAIVLKPLDIIEAVYIASIAANVPSKAQDVIMLATFRRRRYYATQLVR